MTPAKIDELDRLRTAEAARLQAEADARRREEEAAERARLDEERRLKKAVDLELVLAEQEATAASLHVQAVAVLNIRSLVPITLDLASNNYAKWRRLIIVVLRKYALTDHVLSDDLRLDRPSWASMESTILTWLYGTVSARLLEDIMAFDTARAAWLFLEEQFLGEKESRALHLEAEFRKFSQGDLSVAEFSRRLKSMADDLASLDDPPHRPPARTRVPPRP